MLIRALRTSLAPRPDRPVGRNFSMLLLRLAIVVRTMTLVPASGVAFAQVHEPEPGYVDDRSSPEAVIRSL